MPILSASNRSQLGAKLEGVYPANFGIPQSGPGFNLNMLSETFDFTIKNDESKTIRADRQVSEVIPVDGNSAGGFACELQYREYDPFIQGALQADFNTYGTLGVSSALPALTFTSTTISAATAPTGVDAWTTLQKGQWFALIPVAGSSSSVIAYFTARAFKISATVAPTSTLITLDSSTPANIALSGPGMIGGATIGSSYSYNGNTMKSYTFEVGHQDVSQYRQYPGQITSKMIVKLNVGAIVNATFDFMGKSFNLLSSSAQNSPTVSQTFTPANTTRGIFDVFENGTSISTTTYVKAGEFTIDNTLRVQGAVGVFGAAGIGAGTFKANGKLEVYFADATMYTKFLNGTASALTLPVLDNLGNGYVFHFPRIKYTAAKVTVGGMDQDNMLMLDWMATFDSNSASPTYLKTVGIYRVGGLNSGTITPVAVVFDTRARFGYSTALQAGDTVGLPALFASMTALTGSANLTKSGNFNTVASTTNFTWVAVPSAAVPGSIGFFDGTGKGGFSGAGSVGLYQGVETDPTFTFITYVDGNGTSWNMYRSNGKAITYSTFTLV